ncbi:hypothetical protein PG987_010934 [Apiospora arundinis]
MDDSYLDTTPMRQPPPGVVADLVHPVSQSYKLIIFTSIMSAFVAFFTAGRIYTRLKITRSFGADDYLTIASAVFTLAFNFTNLLMCDEPGGGPLGNHLWDTSLRKYVYFSKLAIANSVMARTANCLIKVTFLVFYLRLFGPKNYVRVMVMAGFVAISGFWFAWMIGYLVLSPPGSRFPEGYLAKGYQKHMAGIPTKLITAAGVFSVITDGYIMFIPLHQIPSLGLSYKRKWGISLIFLTGLVATGAGIANLVFRFNPTIMDSTDWTWTAVFVGMTTMAEINLGCMCLSMPVILALFVGRLTAFGQSLGSWVNIRKAQKHGAGDSASDLAASDGNESAPETGKPELPMGKKEDPKLGGMRKFIRNIHRSRASNSEIHNTTVMSTFNDLTSADLSYHAQLKSLHPTQTASSRDNKSESEKLG